MPKRRNFTKSSHTELNLSFWTSITDGSGGAEAKKTLRDGQIKAILRLYVQGLSIRLLPSQVRR